MEDQSGGVSSGQDGSEPVSSKDSDMTRLSEFRRVERFGRLDNRLEKIDVLFSETAYNLYLVSRFWGTREATVIVLSIAGFIMGTWDIGIGEVSGGGDYNRVGIFGDKS
ncbi:MAG: hypothetical protein VYD41_03965, partial [Candidatus Thermoplasmatota archaeon]|nr:hypothetical protein [Candidatus Thermoplasmatota archaeon]